MFFGFLSLAIVCQAGHGIYSSTHSHRVMLLDFSVLFVCQFPDFSWVPAGQCVLNTWSSGICPTNCFAVGWGSTVLFL